MNATIRDLLETVVTPVVQAEGLDLEDLTVAQAGRRRVVRIVVDADGGVDLDRCAEVSRSISAALDSADTLGSAPYTLEVSSPGVSRPLTLPRHWRRATGRLVRVVLVEGGEFTGRLTSADDGSATFDVDGAVRTLELDDVRRARVQVEFNRADDTDDTEFQSDHDADSGVDDHEEG